jgi:beta-galactosidase
MEIVMNAWRCWPARGRALAGFFALAGAFSGVIPSVAQAAESRTTISLDHGWHFKQAADLAGVESTSFDDSGWVTVDVPHTWNRLGNEGTERSSLSNTVQGVGWYRLKFATPGPAARKGSASRYFLQFDGVGKVADVWLNGHYLGKHAGAFARFRFDATPALAPPGGDNLLVVKADNSRSEPGSTTQNVIPLSGDFFVFGGIYRKASLVVTEAVHVDMLDYGGPGVYVRTLSITPEAATVQVTSRLENDGVKPVKVQVETQIEDAEGRVVASAISNSSLRRDAGSAKATASAASPNATTITATVQVPHPHLWQGTQDPYLYRTVVTLRDTKGAILDRVTQPLGLRTVSFDPDKGFFLNGEHLFLHGASMHQDRPVKGWAISDADQKQDFDLLQDMGGNLVRLAHYQHDQRSYELADERGIIVWAEIPLVNQVSFDGSPASPEFSANAAQQLLELIRQNYNHPSIAVWSIANEVDLRATQSQGSSKPRALLESLNRLAKTEDPSRFTTLADCCEVRPPPHESPNAKARDIVVGITDVVGYNYYFGWYSGTFADLGTRLDESHARHPNLPIAISEYGAGAALTQHTDDPNGGPVNPHGRPHPEEYQDLYHEASWNILRTRPYVWGVFIWNMFDFSSDSRREGDLTDINDKGMVSYDRTVAKDAYYFYRANWSSQPTLHLVGRRYIDRRYAVLDVKAYSNAQQARLQLNGLDQGVANCSGGICLWRGVHLSPGENDLHVTAAIGTTQVTDGLRWTFAGSPAVVRIKAGDLSGYISQNNEHYGSDMYFNGGQGKGIDPPDTPPERRAHIAISDGSQPPADGLHGEGDAATLYDSFREGSFSYRIPVPNGRYRVTLRFIEPKANANGERVFNVDLNGKAVLKSVDVFKAAGGKLKGITRSVEGTAKEGYIDLDFKPTRGQALVSALAITPR